MFLPLILFSELGLINRFAAGKSQLKHHVDRFCIVVLHQYRVGGCDFLALDDFDKASNIKITDITFLDCFRTHLNIVKHIVSWKQHRLRIICDLGWRNRNIPELWTVSKWPSFCATFEDKGNVKISFSNHFLLITLSQ